MSHSAENFCKGILLFLRKFLVSKSFMDEKFRGHPFNVSENLGYRKILCILGGITFFRRKILVPQCRKISWASHQCFRKFGVSKNFMHNRGYHNFPAKCRKISWASLQCFKKFGVSKNFMHNRVSQFSVENFLSHSAEKICGHPFNVSENLGYRKILCIIGVITSFRRKFFVSQCRKTS